MIAHQNDMFRSFQNRNKSLRLSRLSRLIDQYLPKLNVPDPAI